MTSNFENLSYPPAGGRNKLVLLGVILPAIVVYFGVKAWVLQEAWWPGRRVSGGGITVRGESAQAMSVVYLSVAAFVHFRWFWGLIQWDRTFQVGTAFAMILFLCALIWALSVT